MATKNISLWAGDTVGPQGPRGPIGPQGPAGPAAGLLDTWYAGLLWPASGVYCYARQVFDGASVEVSGTVFWPVEVGPSSLCHCGYLPTGCEVTGWHFIPIFAFGSQGWAYAGVRVNYDAGQLVSVETYQRPASQFFITPVFLGKNGPAF